MSLLERNFQKVGAANPQVCLTFQEILLKKI